MDEATELRVEIIRNFKTQDDFALAAQCHFSKVSRVLRGRQKLSPEEGLHWAEILSCDPVILAPFVKG